jgi:hypothetical protein
MTKSLLHVGFAKAGSTFLQEWFSLHPQLRFTPHKLAGLSDVHQIADFVHSHSDRSYRYLVTSNELLGSGGRIPYGCPLYSFRMLVDTDLRKGQRDICRVLHDLFPESRVVIVTRGYAGIIRSLYSQYVKLGGKFCFRDYLEAYTPILKQWLDVDYNLRLYRDVFGDDNVIVVPYELLKADVATFVGTLEERLGLDHMDAVPGVRNPSMGPEKLYWYALLSRYIVTPFADLFHRRTGGKIYSFYGFKVVQKNRLGPVIHVMNKFLRRSADLSFPADFMNGFRGMADSLGDNKLYAPFLAEYLIDPASVPKRGNERAFSTVKI